MQRRQQPELLVANFEPLNAQQIENDMDYATRSRNSIVDRLIAIRHNYYTHMNAGDVVADRAIAETYPHMRYEVGDLLKAGLTIVNRYSMLFDLNTWASGITGQDDYHYVLRAIQDRFERYRAERGL